MPSLSHHNLTDQLVDNYKALITKLNASVSFWLPLRRENRAVWIDGLSGAQIAGIVLGILILIVVIGIVGFFLYKK
nr:hypothetical protein BaRGS_007602 [Batillaria attramentaria]